MCDSVLNMSQVLNMSGFSEYASSSKYARVLNIHFLKYNKVPNFFGVFVSRKLEAFLRKYKKLLQNRFLGKNIRNLFSEKFLRPRLESCGVSKISKKLKKFFQGGFFRKKYKKEIFWGKSFRAEAEKCTRQLYNRPLI